MDPFVVSSSSGTRPQDPNNPYNSNTSPVARPFTPVSMNSPSGLRRSTGRINLNLNKDTHTENFHESDTPPAPPSLAASTDIANLTPDETSYMLRGTPHTGKQYKSRRYTNPLKRSHPFNSAKSAKSGVLQPSPEQETIQRLGPKRLHLNDSMNEIMTPDASFKGAKPVQTAFASAGLQSKQSITSSPRLRVPETPCKRPVNLDASFSSINQSQMDPANKSVGNRSWHRRFHSTLGEPSQAQLQSHTKPNTSLQTDFSTSFFQEDDDYMIESPITHPLREHAPVDRLQRFSLSNIDLDMSLHKESEPETPTKLNDINTSTPLRHPHNFASRQVSDAGTITPGTVHRPLPNIIKTIDPSDSLSLHSSGPLGPLGIGSLSTRQSTQGPLQSSGPLGQLSQLEQIGQVGQLGPLGPLPPPIDLDEPGSTPQTPCLHASRKKDPRCTRNIPQLSLFTNQNPSSTNCEQKFPSFNVQTPSKKNTSRLSRGSASPCTPGKSTADVSGAVDEFDDLLMRKFDKVQTAGVGEFSTVFIVSSGKLKYAVKRTKRPMTSSQQKLRRLEEVQILKQLSNYSSELLHHLNLSTSGSGSSQNNQENYDADNNVSHIVQLVDEFVVDNYGYIMTEFCENGDLSKFLAAQGRVSRLEEWRVWKIMTEVLQGLSIVHSAGILHLDLKPANILVTFEGHLKIGDFGMATQYPVPHGFEREGDREYIAPEILERHEYGPSADIFSVGIMMVEIAANIVLPDNGVHWQKLRSGDLTDAGRLSSGDLASSSDSLGSPGRGCDRPPSWAPSFLIDNSGALDRLVQAMLDPNPKLRPSANTLLNMPELMFTMCRGQAGAIVYEGEFGPEPDDQCELAVWQHA